MAVDIRVSKLVRAEPRDAQDGLVRLNDPCGEGARQLPLHRLGEVPEEFVKVAHDGERREHPVSDVGLFRPAHPRECLLGHSLTGPEAVERGAPSEAARPEAVVDAAAEVAAQMDARLAHGFVEAEVRGTDERQGRAAQAEATGAVGAKQFAAVLA